MCENDENYENPNYIAYEHNDKFTPVIEIESDDISTNTQNPYFKEADFIKSNWSHQIFHRPMHVDDYSLLILLKIDDFRKFLDEKKTIEINNINFYLYRFNRELAVTAKIIPSDENFSIKIIFKNDKEITSEKTKSQKKIRKSKTDKNQAKLDNFCLLDSNENAKHLKKDNNLSILNEDADDIYSKELQEILSKNEIILDLSMGIYTLNKKFFTRNQK